MTTHTAEAKRSAPTKSAQSSRIGHVWPDRQAVKDIAARAAPDTKTIPIVREVMADLETPVSAYLKVAQGGPGFILESIEGGERIARYSFIGGQPLAVVTLNNGVVKMTSTEGIREESFSDPLVALGAIIGRYRAAPIEGLPRFLGGLVGYLAYDCIRYFEPRVGLAPGRGLGLPDGYFQLVDSLVVFDNVERTIKAVAHVHLDQPNIDAAYDAAVANIDRLVEALDGPTPPLPSGGPALPDAVTDRGQPNTTPERYREMVEKAKSYIAAGDIFQVVPSQRIDVPTSAHPFTIYRALRTVNPSPYLFYLDHGDHQIVGASPELLVRLEGETVTNHPIAGTRPRGDTPDMDAALAEELLADPKERAEHIMLVDLGRNDVGRVSVPGSVHVPDLMIIERFSHVMHIVSRVEGQLGPELTSFDALRSCFPAGTVSGAPKVRAMEIIAELESDRRGVYSGAVGYVDFSGQMDTCIALRTLVFHDGIASLQAGGGVVADSVPETEFAETLHKMRALRRAIELAEDLEATP